MTEDFSDHPKSVTEVKSDRDMSPSSWTPRDVLIDLLRDIDAGVLDIEVLVVGMKYRVPSRHGPQHGYRVSSPGLIETFGVIEVAKNQIFHDADRA